MFILILKRLLVKPCQNIFAIKKYFPHRPDSRNLHKGEIFESEKKKTRVILKINDETCSPNRFLLFSKSLSYLISSIDLSFPSPPVFFLCAEKAYLFNTCENFFISTSH